MRRGLQNLVRVNKGMVHVGRSQTKVFSLTDFKFWCQMSIPLPTCLSALRLYDPGQVFPHTNNKIQFSFTKNKNKNTITL